MTVLAKGRQLAIRRPSLQQRGFILRRSQVSKKDTLSGKEHQPHCFGLYVFRQFLLNWIIYVFIWFVFHWASCLRNVGSLPFESVINIEAQTG
jgi:hypothetical protein